jgi:hypothetical protein
MAGGEYVCDKKCGKSFESLAMKQAHMFICGGRIHVLRDDTEPERFRDIPMQVLRLQNQAPQKDDAPPRPLHPDAA